MSKLFRAPAIIVLVGMCALTFAEGVPTTLVYKPTAGDHQDGALAAKLADLQINGASMGITGQVSGTVKFGVTSVDADTGDFVLHVGFEGLKADFGGQEREPKAVPPADVTLSRLGVVREVSRGEGAADNPASAGLNALNSGGVPVDVVALFATSVRFPDKPVAVGESWSMADDQNLPILGKTKVTTVTKLVKVEDGKATLESTATGTVQAFEMDNPVMQGKIKVQSGTFSAEKIVREFDMQRSLFTRAKGGFKVDLVTDMGFGAPTPLTAVAEFELKPVEGAAAATPKGEARTERPAPAKAAKTARKPGLALGLLAAGGGYSGGVMSVSLALDMSKAPLPSALQQYRPLMNMTRASGSFGAGVAGIEAGKLSVAGQLQMGPIALRRTASVDLRSLARQVMTLAQSLLPQAAPAQ